MIIVMMMVMMLVITMTVLPLLPIYSTNVPYF